jgi:nitrogen fixation NifU-like protein
MLDASGINPGCGDVVRITAQLDSEGCITEIAFDGQGCTISQASASLFTEMALGQPLQKILALEPTTLADVLGEELVTQRIACVTLALNTLRDAADHQQPDV